MNRPTDNILPQLTKDLDKRIVLDTNVLLYDIDCLKKFKDNNIIIPRTVISEIDGLKRGNSEISILAREMSNILKEVVILNGNPQYGVPISILSKSEILEDAKEYKDNEGKIFIINEDKLFIKYNKLQKNNEDKIDTNNFRNSDDIIINVAKLFNARLVTRDNNMLIKSSLEIDKFETYEADIVKETYKGYRRIRLTTQQFRNFYKGHVENKFYYSTYNEETGLIDFSENTFELYPNEIAIIETDTKSELYGIAKGNRVIKLDLSDSNPSYRNFTSRPKNIEQKLLMILLSDPDILGITINGASGKGKTYLALDYAINSVHKNEHIQTVYTKSLKETEGSEQLSALPGFTLDKMSEVISPLYSSLEGLYNQKSKGLNLPNDNEKEEMLNSTNRILQQGELLAHNLIKELQLTVVPLGYLRGRTIDNRVIILDEGQNVTKHLIKTLVTRVTDKSKLIITGDSAQIDDNNLNKYNNGMAHLIEAGKDSPYIAHLTLDLTKSNQRGKLSQFGNDFL